MKKHERILLWAGLVVATAALLMSIFDIERFDIDPQSLIGWAIAILALLVTVLIAWQIFTLIDIRKIREDVKQKKDDMNTQALYSALNTALSLSDFYYSFILKEDEPEHQKICKYIHYRLIALVHASRLRDVESCDAITRVLLESIHEKTAVSRVSKENILKTMSAISRIELIEGYYELVEKIARLKIT